MTDRERVESCVFRVEVEASFLRLLRFYNRLEPRLRRGRVKRPAAPSAASRPRGRLPPSFTRLTLAARAGGAVVEEACNLVLVEGSTWWDRVTLPIASMRIRMNKNE